MCTSGCRNCQVGTAVGRQAAVEERLPQLPALRLPARGAGDRAPRNLGDLHLDALGEPPQQRVRPRRPVRVRALEYGDRGREPVADAERDREPVARDAGAGERDLEVLREEGKPAQLHAVAEPAEDEELAVDDEARVAAAEAVLGKRGRRRRAAARDVAGGDGLAADGDLADEAVRQRAWPLEPEVNWTSAGSARRRRGVASVSSTSCTSVVSERARAPNAGATSSAAIARLGCADARMRATCSR